MLHILHVVRQFLPSRGGLEDVVYNIARNQMVHHGQEARVLTLNRVFRQDDILPATQSIDGIPVTRLPYRGSERYPLWPGLLHELGNADVVHVHGVDFAFDFLAATRVIHRKPLVASTHGGFFHTEFRQRAKQIYFRTVTRMSANAYRQVLANSANDGATFSKIVSPRRLRVIENGVNVSMYADASSDAPVQRLIYFGRWSVNKGLPACLALLSALRRSGQPWELIIAGREYDLNVESLRALAAEHGVLDRVQLMPDPSNDELRKLMAQASYFLCLSRHEGFGLAAIEALSAGLRPLLSDIPPFRRLADETGVPLILSEDPAAAATQINEAHTLGFGQWDLLRARARRSADRYDWRTVVDDYAKVYENVARNEKELIA
jgi:alpha-1,3-mannosyltransferase